tara:strand:+ start:376 stop:714 length:339 start_codon:yes stop_codon:yes gene_type:complete
MSKKFNAHTNIRIDKVKSHHTYLRPPKDPKEHRQTDKLNPRSDVPWEIRHIANLTAGKPKTKLDMDTIFDIKNDGKTRKVKTISKAEKMKRSYVMMDDRKFHEVEGRFKPMN